MSLDTGSANTAPSTTVVGFYNAPVSGDVFQVGTGSSSNSRRNAFRVLADGRAKVFSKAKEDGDILRFGDLAVKQVSSLDSDVTSTTGDYITGVKFNGDTLKFTKGSSTIKVIDNSTGDIITGIEGENGHTLNITRKNIPDVSTKLSGEDGYFVTGILTNGHGIIYTKNNVSVRPLTTTIIDGNTVDDMYDKPFINDISADDGHGIKFSRCDWNVG